MNDIKRLKHDAICVRRHTISLLRLEGVSISVVDCRWWNLCALYGSVLNLTPQTVESFKRSVYSFKGSRCSWFLPCTLVLRLHQ